MHVELVSPERILYSGDAEMVVARTVDGGDIAFLPGHAPFLGALEICVVKIRTDSSSEELAAVHGGFVHVRDNSVIILSDVAELASDIDTERARKAMEALERSERTENDAEVAAGLARAHVRLDLAGR